MKIFGLEKLSMVDYEGHLCCTVFTAGCNFRCPYCHNSDLVEGRNLHQISEEEFFAFLNKRKGLLDSVCVSGGEPTLQPDLIDFIKKIKELGFKVKLDSNGTAPKLLKELVAENLIDYVAMDIKNSRESYRKTAGNGFFNMENIEESVEFLKQGLVPYEFRTTLVKGHHNDEEIERIATWLDGADRIYLQCFVDNGSCITDGLSKIEKQDAERFKSILSKTIKEVHLRGY